MSRSVRGFLIFLLVLLVLVGLGGALAWWKLSGLKEKLVADLGKSLGATVQVSSIDLDIWKGELHAAGITLVNQRPSSPWDKGDISQITVHFKASDLLSATLPISVEVSSWSVVLHSPLRTAETPPVDAGPDSASAPSSRRIVVSKLVADEGTVEMDFADDRKAVVHGVSFDAENNGADVWTTQLQATSVLSGSLEAGASAVQIRGEEGKVTFSELRMQCDQGLITGDGNVALDGNHDAQVDLKGVDLPVSMLVSVDWQMKVTGLVSGTLHYEGNDLGGGAKGDLAVGHGKFNMLPWLGKVTMMVGLQDISDVEVDKATSDFEWKDGLFHLTNIDVRKTDVTRIAGTVDIDAQGQVDGRLKLGLPSVATSKWPALQAQVFPVQIEDYNWADVHLTGTPDHLEEDLTPRLLGATVNAGVNQGTDLINQTTQKASDLLHSFLGK
jgi:hypothetical protein